MLAKKEEGLKATTLNLYNSAIRFFYRNVLHILWDDITVPRMILEHKLPTVLTASEIDRLLDAVDDIKYKAMFAVMYSSGMRVSEVIHLHYDDISRSNMQIHVRDAPYFHLVFTVPDILNPVIYSNQKLLYDTLYHAASATIQELTSDPKHLGASVGYICILHTWGSEMNFHPHIHMILLGGGLTPKNEWKDNGTEFFLPIWAISKVFRGKYMDELKNL